jgi:hypothetical protein
METMLGLAGEQLALEASVDLLRRPPCAVEASMRRIVP